MTSEITQPFRQCTTSASFNLVMSTHFESFESANGHPNEQDFSGFVRGFDNRIIAHTV